MGFGMKVSLAKASTFGGITLRLIPEFQREIATRLVCSERAVRRFDKPAHYSQWVPWKMMFSGLK